MRLRKRHGFTRQSLNTLLRAVMPDSVHVYAYQFGADRRWSACTATHSATGVILGWVSPTTYATQHEALAAAYHRARPVMFPQPVLMGFPQYVRFSKS